MKEIYLPAIKIKPLTCTLISLLFFLIPGVEILAQTQQVITTSGAGTFTIPAGVTQVTVECWGGGGNGGSTGNNGIRTGGGGGGAYARKLLTVIPGNSYPLTVGAAGNDSWFNSNLIVLAKGGTSVATNATGGGAGGSAALSIGDQVYGGGNGGNAGGTNTGGGGSSAGNSANGNNATGATPGAAPGGGGAGAIGLTGNGNGNPGNNPGGGGSGGWRQGSGGAAGSGAVGKVVISYYLLTGTSVPATVCQNTTATVTLTGTTINLPVGTYTVTYNLTGANTATNATATMTVSSAGTGTFTTASLSNAGSTTVTITKLASGFYGSSVGSNNTATFNVSSPAQPSVAAGGPTTFCAGGSVVLTSSPGSSYKWYSDGVLIPAATVQTYTATASAAYTVVVTNGSGCISAPSADMVVTVNSLPANPTITAGGPTTFCADGNLTLSSTIAAGYQWYKGGVLIAGETNQDYSPTTSGVYTVVVSNALGCFSSPSSGVNVTVNPLPATPGITPGSATTFCSGLSVILTSDLATSYQWYELSGIIPAATNRNYTANATGSYYVKVTNSFGCIATSAVENVTVNPLPDITLESQATGLCAGASAQITQLAFTNTDNSPTTYSITWNATALGAGFVNVLNPALPVLPTPISISVPASVPANTYTGTLTVKNADGCQSTSKSFTVTVATTPDVSNFSISAASGCVGTGAVITVNSTSLSDGVYNVKYDLSGSNVATNSTAVLTFSGNSGTFTAAASNAGATTITVTEIALVGCFSTVNNTANFTINTLPVLPTISGLSQVCVDGSITLTSNSLGGMWSSSETSVASVNNTTGLVTGILDGISTIKYTTALDGNGCSNFNTHDVTVNALPVVEPITGQTSYCVTTSATLSNATPNGIWSSSNNSIATIDNTGLVDALLVGSTVITYTTQVNAAGCFNFSTANVVVNPDPAVVVGADETVCESASPAFITLSGASYSGGASAAFWTIENGGSGTLSAQGSGNNPWNVRYTPAANFYGTITLKLTTNAVGTCGTASDTRLINITQKPTVIPGSPITVCESSAPAAITLSTAAVGGSATTGTWSVVAPGGGTLSDASPVTDPANVTYTPTANFSGTVTLRLTSDAIGVCGTTSADRIITMTQLPIAVGGAQNSVCQSATPGSVSLTGAGISGGATSGVWTISLGSGTLSNINPTANPQTVSFTPAANFTGTVKLTLTTDAPGGCLATSAERIIDVTPASTIIAGGPDNICQSATPGALTLSGASVAGGATTGTWTVAVGTLSSTNPETNPGTVTYTPDVNYSGTVSLLLTTNATGNCPAVNATRTITIAPNATITLTSAPTTTSQTPCINSLITPITYSIGGGGTGATFAGLPSGVSGTFSAGIVTISGTPTVSGLFSFTVTATSATCASATATGTIDVSAASVGGSFTPSLVTVCSGASPSFNLSGFTGSITGWQQSINAGGTWNNIASTTNPYTATSVTQTTLYRAIVKNGVCTAANSSAVQLVIDAPFTPTVTAITSPACIGTNIVLAASGYTSSGLVIDGGDFASANPPGWNGASANNNSQPANAGWGESNGPKTFNGVSYNSNGKFMIIPGTGTPGTNSLTTPVFTLVGLSSAYLAFNHAYNLVAGASAQVRISIDGGISYSTLQTFTGSGAAPGFTGGTNAANFGADPKVFINLDTYLGMTNLKLEFLYTGVALSNWAVDNIVVTNSIANPNGVNVFNNVNYSWTAILPASTTFLSATNVQTPTFNSTTSGAGTFTYNVTTTTSTAGCSGAEPGTVTVVVNPATVAGTLPGNVSVCSPSSTNIVLSGTTGSVVRWESSINGGTTWTNIANTTTELNASVVAATTLYRAYVQSGACPAAYSTVAKAGLSNYWTGAVSTDWQNANNWSDGVLPAVSLTCPTVTIPNTVNKPILANGTSTITSLSIQASAALTVNNTGLLTIGGTITNAGTFNVSDGSLEFNGTTPQSISGALFTGNDIKNLRISNTSGTGLSISGVALNVLGELDFGTGGSKLTTNDLLILRSTATSTARVADITANGTGNQFIGKVTVERYYPGNRSWRLNTSPLSGTGTIFQSWQNNGVYTPGQGMFVTGLSPSITNGLDASTQNNFSMKKWDGVNNVYVNVDNTKTGAISLLSAASGPAANIGYFTFVRGDRSRTPDNTILPNTNNTTLSSIGFLQTGPQTFNVVPRDTAFTLIGNPYASPVDFSKLTRSNVLNRFIVWDPLLNDVGGFITFDDGDNDGLYDSSAVSPGGLSKYIQSSQAFFVQTTSTGSGFIRFDEPNKSSVYKAGMFRPMPATASDKKELRIRLYKFKSNNTKYLADGTLSQFSNDYSDKVQNEDAFKFININETFSFVRYGRQLAIERRPEIKERDTLFLKLTKSTRRKYTMEIVADNLAHENLAGFIEDKFLKKLTPLNMNDKTDVGFEVTADAASADPERFKIIFKPSVVYTNINAKVIDCDVAVNWSVADEFNIKEYEIERSSDGVNFIKTGIKAATGNLNAPVSYQWTDVSPAVGYYYYRIKSVSNNNVIGYSNVAQVKINKAAPQMYVLPNPVTGNVIQLQMNSLPEGVYDARLLNTAGQLIFADLISHAPGTATETLKPAKKLTAGVYQLKVISPAKKITVIKILVE